MININAQNCCHSYAVEDIFILRYWIIYIDILNVLPMYNVE